MKIKIGDLTIRQWDYICSQHIPDPLACNHCILGSVDECGNYSCSAHDCNQFNRKIEVSDELFTGAYIPAPCKLGQSVWVVRKHSSKAIVEEAKIEKIVLTRTGLHMKLSCNSMYETSCTAIGKYVFFTEEEAVAAAEKCNERK